MLLADRETERRANGQTGRLSERKMERGVDGQTESWTEKWMGRWAIGQTERWAEKWMGREGQTGRGLDGKDQRIRPKRFMRDEIRHKINGVGKPMVKKEERDAEKEGRKTIGGR